MKHCKDCSFYDERRSICEKASDETGAEENSFRLKIVVNDEYIARSKQIGVDYSVDLEVDPLFGCVQWKQKDEN